MSLLYPFESHHWGHLTIVNVSMLRHNKSIWMDSNCNLASSILSLIGWNNSYMSHPVEEDTVIPLPIHTSINHVYFSRTMLNSITIKPVYLWLPTVNSKALRFSELSSSKFSFRLRDHSTRSQVITLTAEITRIKLICRIQRRQCRVCCR